MKRALCVLIVSALAALAAAGAQVSYTDTILATQTNWIDQFELPLFDSTLGTLQSIQLVLDAKVSGDIQVESLEPVQPSVINATLSALLFANPMIGSIVLVPANPQLVQVFNATAFDGAVDFAGTSGASFLGLSAMDSSNATSSAPADLLAFTGLGTWLTNAGALGTSRALGAGNVITQFRTIADAELTVIYTYNEIPEPSLSMLMGSGLLGLGLLARRIKRA